MVWFSGKKKMFKENVSANFSTFLKNGKIKNENISSDPFSSLDGALNTYIHTPITKQWQQPKTELSHLLEIQLNAFITKLLLSCYQKRNNFNAT